MKNLQAIRFSDFKQFGCPICGYDKGQGPTKGPNWIEFICGQCNTKSFLLGKGLLETPFEIDDPPVKLAVVRHLRIRTLAHSKYVTDYQELKNVLFQFEQAMEFDAHPTYIKLNGSKAVETLEENFPHVINAIGKYIKEITVSPNFKTSMEEEWMALVPWILAGKIDQEDIPDLLNLKIEELSDWCINFKYEP